MMVDNTNSSLELEVDISSFLSMPLTHAITTKSKILEIRLILLVIVSYLALFNIK